jgi:allantoinase
VLLSGLGNPEPACLEIRDGTISRVLGYDEKTTLPLIEGGDLTLTPGIFDTHAHINEPGRTDWEGFQTATRAAAAGGITSVIDMPLNSIPATTTLRALMTKIESAKGKTAVNYGFWGGVVPGNADELEPMVKAGVLGFKCFLVDSGVEEFPKSEEFDLEIAMPILAKLGVPLLVHAELECGVETTQGDEKAYSSYLASRPDEWEVRAIRMMIRLSKKTGCAVHIVHLSSAEALKDIEKAKKDGVRISVETCPHYLYFESESIPSGATEFKCAPPIRSHGNKENLWNGLKNGVIDFIVSDHSPCTPALKAFESGSFDKAWGGISGLQFSLPVVWTEMKKRGLNIRQLSTWMTARTASFAGQASFSGEIKPGLRADFILWNPEEKFSVTEKMIQHRHPVTPYVGRELYGKVHKTFVNGELVYDEGEFKNGLSGRRILRSSNGV